MVKTQRIQLSRKRGFRLQEFSLKLNGLTAVKCTRPGKWGNPTKVGPGETPHFAVACFRDHLRSLPELVAKARRELAGKNLACFCRLDQECHCDVWLEVLASLENNS